ncbi:MAG: hypothetical protein K0R77_124 [Chryseobacterium sp.]|jgi:hypothetical protein|uniref:hypothetical protein n=1 Tax=Chryseobacterium sp. TaxID=1871047 RepID=UPI00262FE5E7|nr:hypothetical protein [Chryseobacterium sp.]MDF2550849.1 hypothetical protein [Chryseobacterium sp.]
MNFKFLCLFILILVFSCTSQKSEIEYVEFEHECYIRKISDKILIRILPSQKKYNKERIVELIYHGKSFVRKSISEKEYQNIVDSIFKISEKDSTMVFTDGGSNIIEYRKGDVIKKHYSQVLNKDYNNTFYNTCELITESAGLDITAIK